MSEVAGTSFQAAEVVQMYRHRPPYAAQIHDRITEAAPACGRLLDLGCGEGKLARPMTQRFDEVVAVDPSANMIAFGQSLDHGQAANLRWIEAKAEDAPLDGQFDVVTFASSIHWMDPARLFSMLARHLNEKQLLAVIAGDEPFEPPWHDDWRRFLSTWVPEVTGNPLDDASWRDSRVAYKHHVAEWKTEDHLSDPVQQSIEGFVLCQHSRDTFAVDRLGDRGTAFRKELTDLLTPHADDEGQLSYRVKTQLTLARR